MICRGLLAIKWSVSCSGKTRPFQLLIDFFFFFSSQWKSFSTLLMSVTLRSITLRSTRASSKQPRSCAVPSAPSTAVSAPAGTAHRLQHTAQFLFVAGFWITNELPIYKSQLTGCLFTRTTLQYSWSHQSGICAFVFRVCGPTSSFLLFLSKPIHLKSDALSNFHCLIFRWISLFLAISRYWIPPELFEKGKHIKLY